MSHDDDSPAPKPLSLADIPKDQLQQLLGRQPQQTVVAGPTGRPVQSYASSQSVPDGPTSMVLTDVDIDFWRMVWILVKLGFASIPAIIIIYATIWLVGLFVQLLGLGLAASVPR